MKAFLISACLALPAATAHAAAPATQLYEGIGIHEPGTAPETPEQAASRWGWSIANYKGDNYSYGKYTVVLGAFADHEMQNNCYYGGKGNERAFAQKAVDLAVEDGQQFSAEAWFAIEGNCGDGGAAGFTVYENGRAHKAFFSPGRKGRSTMLFLAYMLGSGTTYAEHCAGACTQTFMGAPTSIASDAGGLGFNLYQRKQMGWVGGPDAPIVQATSGTFAIESLDVKPTGSTKGLQVGGGIYYVEARNLVAANPKLPPPVAEVYIHQLGSQLKDLDRVTTCNQYKLPVGASIVLPGTSIGIHNDGATATAVTVTLTPNTTTPTTIACVGGLSTK